MVDVEQIIRDNLNKTLHLSLATCVNNRPWVCELHYAYDDQLNLYFRSKPDRRHSQELSANPQVAGNIVQQYSLEASDILGIYFEGTARHVTTPAEQATIFPYFKRIGATEAALEEAATPDGHQFYAIAVSKWYIFGKFAGQPGQKYQLDWPKSI